MDRYVVEESGRSEVKVGVKNEKCEWQNEIKSM